MKTTLLKLDKNLANKKIINCGVIKKDEMYYASFEEDSILFDINGNILKKIAGKIYHLNDDLYGLCCTKAKCGLIDKQGNLVIEAKYDDIWYFDDGLAKVKLNKKWGFIDKQGNLVIKAKYDDVDDFREGLAGVNLNRKWGFIDKKGKIIIKAKYDFIDDKDDEMVMFGSKHGLYLLLFKENILGCFHEGLALARINKKYGFIDKNENLVIEAKYDEVEDFDKGLAIAKLDGKSGLLDKNGRVIVDFLYEKILVVNKDIIILVKNNEILIQKI
ncbi:WG repeat-containing protein [Campylobacter jejuni]|nr:WG repeat-containing protein [Campylobacter jejuni]EJB0949049.1 WG repeat-containing protein [Campylobacter jejuni]